MVWIEIHKSSNIPLVQSLSHAQLFATPWTAARQYSMSITNSRSLLKLMSIELVMPSNHLILCHCILLLPSMFASIRVFTNESVLINLCQFSLTFAEAKASSRAKLINSVIAKSDEELVLKRLLKLAEVGPWGLSKEVISRTKKRKVKQQVLM